MGVYWGWGTNKTCPVDLCLAKARMVKEYKSKNLEQGTWPVVNSIINLLVIIILDMKGAKKKCRHCTKESLHRVSSVVSVVIV